MQNKFAWEAINFWLAANGKLYEVERIIHGNTVYNSILAPNLPYDEDICVAMCQANYWLPKCNCMMDFSILKYAGNPPHTPLCPLEAENDGNANCTRNNVVTNTPAKEIAKCECTKSCESYTFEVTGQDKIHYDFGKMENIFILSLFA